MNEYRKLKHLLYPLPFYGGKVCYDENRVDIDDKTKSWLKKWVGSHELCKVLSLGGMLKYMDKPLGKLSITVGDIVNVSTQISWVLPFILTYILSTLGLYVADEITRKKKVFIENE